MFRGSINDLENQNILLTLTDNGIVFSKVLSKKQVNLKGILSEQKIKTDLMLINSKTNEKYYTTIQGFVTIDHKIKHIQHGENVNLISTKKYLCVSILKVENIKPAESRGIVDSFITCEWV